MDRPQFLAEAIAIANQLRMNCLSTTDGGVAWLGPVGYGTELSPLRKVKIGPQLHDGTTGIALFFAALARVEEGSRHRDMALRILQPLRRKLAALTAAPERAEQLRTPVGGLIGLGSFIYGLLKVGELLNEPSLIREAHAATVLITPERIDSDRQGRIRNGCAGAILNLLALHAKFPERNAVGKTPLDIACDCARHLLDLRISYEGRPRAWALSPGKPPLAGFSYGAAGISYALLHLHEATRRQDFLDAAHEGLAFVRGLYSPEHGSWRDLRSIFQSRYRPLRGTWNDWWAGTCDDLEEIPDPPPPENSFPAMWCHGDTGIALGRIGSLALEDSPEARQEIEGSLCRARFYARNTEALDGPDDLCCGHMGLLELLLCAYQKLGDHDALDTARILIDRVLRRAEARGRFELSAARGTDNFAPSLFQGIAGVGYSLLRLAAPEEIPCLLLLD
jgi:lantibiotic modifying enzyme